MSKTSSPEISVIVPLFNRENLIEETLQSVISQTYPNWELIVIDDGSTDASKEIAERIAGSDDRIQVFSRPDHLLPGGNGARNYGFSIARGKYVMWLDSDDLITEDCLNLQLDNLEHQNSDVSFCQAQMFTLGEGGEMKLGRAWCDTIDPNGSPLKAFVNGKVKWQTSTGLWRKKFFPTAHPFEEKIENGQEWLMHGMMLLHEPRVAYLSRVLIWIREHGNRKSQSSQIARYNINRLLGRYLFISEVQKKGMKRYMTMHLLRKQRAYFLQVFRTGNWEQKQTAFQLFSKTLWMYAGRMIP